MRATTCSPGIHGASGSRPAPSRSTASTTKARDVQQLLDWVATQPQVALDVQRRSAVRDGRRVVRRWHPVRHRGRSTAASTRWCRSSRGTRWRPACSRPTREDGLGQPPRHGSDPAGCDPRSRTSPQPTERQHHRHVRSRRRRVVRTIGARPSSCPRSPSRRWSIQGTVDTLFTLDEAVTNYELLQDDGVPTSMLWFCGGHGVCLTDPGDQARVSEAAVAWLDRYVNLDDSADIGSRVRVHRSERRHIHVRWVPRRPMASRSPPPVRARCSSSRTAARVLPRGGGGRRRPGERSCCRSPRDAPRTRSSVTIPAPASAALVRRRADAARSPTRARRSRRRPPDPGLRAVGRRHDGPRARQSDHADRGRARRRQPHHRRAAWRWSHSTSSPAPASPCSWWPPRSPTRPRSWVAPSRSTTSRSHCRWSPRRSWRPPDRTRCCTPATATPSASA